MKKTFLIFIFIIIIYILIGNVIVNKNIIPEDAIRIRIIANSNSDYDQQIKLKVKNNLETNLYNLLKSAKSSEEAKKILNNNIGSIKNNITTTLQSESYNKDFTINLGKNYFPQKEYKGIIYNEGYYESLVITLGDGLGDNWWCVLYPPLCTIESEDKTDVEYTTMVEEILDKYF